MKICSGDGNTTINENSILTKEKRLTCTLVGDVAEVLNSKLNLEHENAALKIKLLGFDQKRSQGKCKNGNVSETDSTENYEKEIENLNNTLVKSQNLYKKLQKELTQYTEFLKEKLHDANLGVIKIQQIASTFELKHAMQREKLTETISNIKQLIESVRNEKSSLMQSQNENTTENLLFSDLIVQLSTFLNEKTNLEFENSLLKLAIIDYNKNEKYASEKKLQRQNLLTEKINDLKNEYSKQNELFKSNINELRNTTANLKEEIKLKTTLYNSTKAKALFYQQMYNEYKDKVNFATDLVTKLKMLKNKANDGKTQPEVLV